MFKNKLHSVKRPTPRGSSSAHPGGHVVALVDERYLIWLAEQQDLPQEASLQYQALNPVLMQLARQTGVDGPWLRSYLYTDRYASEPIDDVLLRNVPRHDVDGGLGLVRALGQELLQLSQRGGCASVLLASDDERLIPYIDEAQSRGLRVVLITDQSVQQFSRLKGEDPSWARLILQADRRAVVSPGAWHALMFTGTWPLAQSSDESVLQAHEPEPVGQVLSDEWRQHIQQVIAEWWSEESEHARLDLYEEMQNIQGVPPETDRHLLLRVRREMARTLSFAEKKAMRELIRATVLEHPPVVQESQPE